MTPSGWTQTYPSAGGANAVTLGTGQLVDSENFGDYTPSQTKSYSSTNVPLKLKTQSGASITSTLTLNDAATIFDLNVSINVTTTSTSLAFTLTAPDGTSVSVQPGTTHVTGLDYHGTNGTWTLKMWNVAPAPKPSTLNAWSLQILESTTTLSSPLTASPSSATAGSSGTSNVPGMSAPSSMSNPSSSNPFSAAEQVLANLALMLSETRNAYQTELSAVAALWQSADALVLQRLDALLSLEAGAMGLTKDHYS